jgi:hypothetical protein
MKRLATLFAVLGIMTMANAASAYEFTPGQHCQVTDYDTNSPVVSYTWMQMYAGANGAYAICPVTRTYSSVNQATAYVNNPSDATTWGYLNFVSTDASYTNYNSASTATAGNVSIAFAPINTSNHDGFVNFEMYVPANGGIYGFFSN